MLSIIKERLEQGHRTSRYPAEQPQLSDRLRGLPLLDSKRCGEGCQACAEACPTDAMSVQGGELKLDLGRCLFCTDCMRACPDGAITYSQDYRLATRNREDLVIDGRGLELAQALDRKMQSLFGRSLKLRVVSAGGCNGCESDVNVLGTIVFDLGRFGIQFVASPRHADGLLITGPVTENMKLALEKTYDAIPAPKLVIAVGACAISGGPYIGHTLSGSRAPVQFDLAEACQQSRPPTCLLAGSLGSGKTIALELLAWQAFLQGSGPIVDIDPKGDHRLEALPGVAEAIETIELSGEDRYRGLLDPMRVGAQETREDLAYNFLVSILPVPVKPEWQTQLRLAISEAAAAGAQSCGEVLERMSASGSDEAGEAARAIEVHGRGGLAKLGLGRGGEEIAAVGEAAVVSLRIRNLTLPLAGTARSELLEEERTSLAVLRLLAAYALRLCATNTGRHSVLAMDEAAGSVAGSRRAFRRGVGG